MKLKLMGDKCDVVYSIYIISNELYKVLIMKRKQLDRRATEPYADPLYVP